MPLSPRAERLLARAATGDARAVAALRRYVGAVELEGRAMADRFERAVTDARGWHVEVEDGAACVAFFAGRHVTNGQATVAACFDEAYDRVWGPSGTMRREFEEQWHAPRALPYPLQDVVRTERAAGFVNDLLACGHWARPRTPENDPTATRRRCFDCPPREGA